MTTLYSRSSTDRFNTRIVTTIDSFPHPLGIGLLVTKTVNERTTSHNAYMTATGVVRWTSNNAVLMADVIREYSFDQVPGFDAAAHETAYHAELAKIVAGYRAERAQHGYSAEERADMRAAFGDEPVVDIITGERVDLGA